MAKLSMEQNLLLFVISHQYVLLDNSGEIEEDAKRAICGTFAAIKMEYKIPALMDDIAFLEEMRLIEKNSKDKRYDITIIGKNNPALIIADEKKGPQTFPPPYDNFIKTYWVLFCSFLRVPIVEMLKEIDNSESKTFSDLNIVSDIATSVLCDLAIKRGFLVREPNAKDPKQGLLSLTDSGKELIANQK